MKLLRILEENNKEFNEAWKIYEDSFPVDEKRKLEDLIKILGEDIYSFYAIHDMKEIIGILEIWDFNDFILIEHIAIREDLRNQGIGTRIMKKFIEDNKKIIVVEIEKPETEIAKRRIRSWKRLNFKINRYDYIQPAYSKGKNPVPMFLISYPGLIKKSEYLGIIEEIYKKVYGYYGANK